MTMFKFSNIFFYFYLYCLGMFGLLLMSNFDGGFLVSFKFLFKLKLGLDFLMMFDFWSMVFFCALNMILGKIYLFSFYYMNKDYLSSRFKWVIFMFYVSMCFLIFLPHSIFMFLGWDGLGFSSFLLVAYYSTSSSWSGSLKTFLINRFGDCLLFLTLIFIIWSGFSWYTYMLFYSKNFYMLIICFFFCCSTKSAQYPFSSWLPVAMVAPTPVSALVHSSTLVTSGVYLMLRISPVINNGLFSFFISFMGLITLLFSKFCGLFEWDSKKMVAFSTLAQMGLMFFSIGCGLYWFCFFHIMTHAFLKACAFICIGYSLLFKFHFQDLRSLMDCNKIINSSVLCLLWCLLGMSGFPFLSVFYSKDCILLMGGIFKKLFMFMIFFFTMGITLMYSMRLFMMLFSMLWKFSFLKFLNLMKKWFYFFSYMNLFFFGMFFGKMFYFYFFTKIKLVYSIMSMYMMVFSLLLIIYYKFFNILYFFNSMVFLGVISGGFLSNIGVYFKFYIFKIFEKFFKKLILQFLNMKNMLYLNNFYNNNKNNKYIMVWVCFFFMFMKVLC